MNIYVGNLSKTASEESVRKLFEAHGEVKEVKLIKDQFTNELRGFGFITMSSSDDGKKAIEALNDTKLDGRKLVVNEARPRKDRPGGGGGRPGGGRGGYGGGKQGGGFKPRNR